MEAASRACCRMYGSCSGMRLHSQAFRRSSAVQGFYDHCSEYCGTGLDGARLHGTMGFMDNYEYSECSDVDRVRDPWRGSCRRDGDNVGVLSVELHKRPEGMAEAK